MAKDRTTLLEISAMAVSQRKLEEQKRTRCVPAGCICFRRSLVGVVKDMKVVKAEYEQIKSNTI